MGGLLSRGKSKKLSRKVVHEGETDTQIKQVGGGRSEGAVQGNRGRQGSIPAVPAFFGTAVGAPLANFWDVGERCWRRRTRP